MTESTKYEHILVEHRDDDVGVITINRPEKLNACSSQTRREICTAMKEMDAAPAIGAVVFTGSGERAFCAGQDLAESRDFRAEHGAGWASQWKEVHTTIISIGKPTIAAVNGYAVGAGCQMTTDCDLRVASEDARFGLPEIDDGIACIGGIQFFWDLVGRARTADIVLTGRMINAEEALDWGLVKRVVPKQRLMEAALELARSLAAKPRIAMRLNKQWLRELALARNDRAIEVGRRAHTEAYASGEPQQVMAEFLAKKREGRSR